MDECFGFGEDEDNPTVIHQRDKDVYRDSPEEWGLKQYSFFANVFNYKESMLLDSLRILKKGMWVIMSLETFDQLSPEEKVESMYQEIQSLNYKWETTTNLLIKRD